MRTPGDSAPLEGDDVFFMQTSSPRAGSGLDTSVRMLQSLPTNLRELVVQELRRLRLRWSAVQNVMAQLPHVVDAGTPPPDAGPLVEAIVATVEPLLFAADECLLVAGPESVPLDVATAGTDDHLERPSLPVEDMDTASGDLLVVMVDFVDQVVETMIQDLGYEMRFQGLREVLKALIQMVKGRVCQLRVLVALLARRLPQPNLRAQDASLPLSASMRLRRVLQQLVEQLEPQVPSFDDAVPIAHDDAIPHCGPMSSLGIDLMSFLENGEFDFLNDTVMSGGPDHTASANPIGSQLVEGNVADVVNVADSLEELTMGSLDVPSASSTSPTAMTRTRPTPSTEVETPAEAKRAKNESPTRSRQPGLREFLLGQ